MLGTPEVRKHIENQGHPNGIAGRIKTCTGKWFDYTDLESNLIDMLDIAHALSNICRFNGHVDRFYSVAQHSLLVSEKMPGTPKEKLAALLHDAAEAYVCDIPSPLKPRLGEDWHDLHDDILNMILKKFGIHNPPWNQIKMYDYAACLFEAEALGLTTPSTLEQDGWNPDLRCLWTPWTPKVYARFVAVATDTNEGVCRRFLIEVGRLQNEIRKGEEGI